MCLNKAVNKCRSSEKQGNDSNDYIQIDARGDGACGGQSRGPNGRRTCIPAIQNCPKSCKRKLSKNGGTERRIQTSPIQQVDVTWDRALIGPDPKHEDECYNVVSVVVLVRPPQVPPLRQFK